MSRISVGTDDLDIPEGPEALTVEWMRLAIGDGAGLREFQIEAPAGVQGLFGRLRRVRLDHEREEATLPRSVMVKFHPAELELRQRIFAANLAEVCFYRDVAPTSPLAVPRCFCGLADPETGSSVLVLEEMDRSTQVDELKGLSPTQAELATRELAAFHATWWGQARLERLEWLPRFDRSLSVEIIGDPAGEFEGPIPEGFGEVASRIRRHIHWLFEANSRPPRTLALNDIKARHMLFGRPPTAPALAVVDFQFVAKARGPLDLARFCGSSLTVEMRRAIERDLLRTYHDLLLSRGIDGYDFNECFDDYRRGHLQNMVDYMAVEAQGLQARGGAEAERIQKEQLERYVAAIMDLDCTELLPG